MDEGSGAEGIGGGVLLVDEPTEDPLEVATDDLSNILIFKVGADEGALEVGADEGALEVTVDDVSNILIFKVGADEGALDVDADDKGSEAEGTVDAVLGVDEPLYEEGILDTLTFESFLLIEGATGADDAGATGAEGNLESTFEPKNDSKFCAYCACNAASFCAIENGDGLG